MSGFRSQRAMNTPIDRLTGAMNNPDSDPALWAIEALLAREAARTGVPPGLARRVYQGSVGGLPVLSRQPRRSPRHGLEPLVFVRLAFWGRLAMAASIGLAFVVASNVGRVDSRTRLAAISPDVELVLLDLAGLGDVDHLLITREMTFRDLDGDVAAMAVTLDMGRDM